MQSRPGADPLSEYHAFDADDVARAWDGGADAWDEFVESGADYFRDRVHAPALPSACGDVVGKRLIDLGCGQGAFSRRLADAGAKVTGADISAQQIEKAEAHERYRPLGIAYHRLDVTTLADRWDAHAFDLATACMALNDMPDATGVLAAVRHVLVPAGRFVFSVPHPMTDTPFREWDRAPDGTKRALKIDRYFESGAGQTGWTMDRLTSHWSTPHWRRTLEEWWDLVANAGFLIRALREPRPSADDVAARPELDDSLRLPYFLIIDAQRGEPG